MIALSLLAFAVQFATQFHDASAQQTSAVCEDGYSWMDNSRGQSPCLIASYLLLPCSSTAAAIVFPLLPGQHYNTPTTSPVSATPCRCNSVFYSVISACATCQGEGLFVPSWTTYAQNCSSVYLKQYPEDIPAGTAVPAWAFLDVTDSNTFDPVAAEASADQDAPESTASSNNPTTTTGNVASPTETSDDTPRSPNQSPGDNGDSSGSKKSSKIGPIVGGVVGGVVGVLAIALAIFFWVRHRRNAARDAPTGPVDLTAGEYGQYVEKPVDSGVAIVPSPLPSPKIYNPDDPSTFPDSLDAHTASMHGSGTDSGVRSSYPSALPYAYSAGGYQPSTGAGNNPTYRGAPEL